MMSGTNVASGTGPVPASICFPTHTRGEVQLQGAEEGSHVEGNFGSWQQDGVR